MFERILLPLDGSEVAELALPYGEELARALGAELVLLHVRGQEHQPDYEHIHKMYLERLAETVQRNIRKGQADGKAMKVTTKVDVGEPTENICSLVEKSNVDLIIMASVSASGLRIGKTVGSVADQVCRTVPIPVMLIRPQSTQQNSGKEKLINNILVPLDGSDLSKLALPAGEELASNLKAKITLFRMSNMIVAYVTDMAGGAFVDYSQFDKAEEERVRAEMTALEKQLAAKGLNVSNVVTAGYDAAGDILEVSKKVGADLVVMSTHGRSGLGKWVFGNVAEKILRHGETPLLLVHAKAG